MSDQPTVGFALCGSFCTFSKVIPQIEKLVSGGYHVIPIMSPVAYETDTRFGKAREIRERIEAVTKNPILHTVEAVEPFGPKKLLDILVIAPCTGNTLGKLACGIYDTAPTLSFKSHLRNARPVVIAVSTNDGLAASARNIGQLHNMKHIYFVPYRQDDPEKKPASLVANMELILPTVEQALIEKQIQPVLL